MSLKMRLRATVLLFVGVSAVGIEPAWATYQCDGLLQSVALNPNGLLTVNSADGGLNAAYVCQIGSTYNGVSSDACKAIYAMLMQAWAMGKVVSWNYSDSYTCSTRPSWTMLTGWYYGPFVTN